MIPAERKVRLGFLVVNSDPETKKTSADVKIESNLVDWTIALCDPGANPLVSQTTQFQGRECGYIFVFMTGKRSDGSPYQFFYLFGDEPRYSEMKSVADEFGVG